MSKLTVANLFRSVRALNDSHGMSPRSAHLVGENLWRLTTTSDPTSPPLELSDLLSAVRYVFATTQPGGAQSEADFAAWQLQQSERQLRFDPEHVTSSDKSSPRDRLVPEPAAQALRQGLGAIQARQRLGSREWVVIVIDAQAPGTELPAEFLERLPGLERVLMLWCDAAPSTDLPHDPRSAPASAFERLSNSPDLVWLGPIGGLESDGMVAVLEALKALEKPAVLHLRLGSSAGPADSASQAAICEAFSANRGDEDGRAALVAAPRSRTSLALAAERFSRRAAADRRLMGFNLLSDQTAASVAPWLDEFGFSRLAPSADSLDTCAGLADGGCRPFLLLDGASLQRLWGPLAERICEAKRPAALIVAPSSPTPSSAPGLVADLVDQLGLLPNLAVLVPRDAAELERMVASAAAHDGPAAICLPPWLADAPGASGNASEEFGKAAALAAGKDAALFALGNGVALALEAAAQLARRGVAASVIDLRCVRPLDEAAVLQAIKSASAAMCVTDGLEFRGFDRIVSELMARSDAANCTIVPCPAAAPDSLDSHDRRARRIREIADRCLEALRSSGASKATPIASVRAEVAALRSGGAAQEEQRQIQAVQLSPTIAPWVAEYSKVGTRGLYLWKWCRHGLAVTTLPCVPSSLHDDVCDTKLLSILLCVLLDDVADQHGKRQLLEALLDPSARGRLSGLEGLSKHERDYAALTWRVWDEFYARIQHYPRRQEFAELLNFDLLQLDNTLRYSHLLNEQLNLLNLAEHDLYSPHNIMMVCFATLDLMCSPDFPRSEVGRLREAVWHAQCMGRIGNLLSTWRREIADRDFTSGVFARAVMEGDLTVDELLTSERERIEEVICRGGHEEYFLRRWQEHRAVFHSRIGQLQLPGFSRLLEGHERMFRMHIGSEGLI